MFSDKKDKLRSRFISTDFSEVENFYQILYNEQENMIKLEVMQVYCPSVSNLRVIYMCGSLKQQWTILKEKLIYENCVDYQFATHLVFHEFVCLTCILILMFNKHLLSTFYLCSILSNIWEYLRLCLHQQFFKIPENFK